MKQVRLLWLIFACTIAWAGIVTGGWMLSEERSQTPVAAERAIVSRLKSLGGRVTLDRERHVERADLLASAVTDADLQLLAELRQLSSLVLAHCHVTDTGLSHLQNCVLLRELDLAQTQISDAGLQHLNSLQELATLNLSETQIGDQGVQHLLRLTKLKRLRLSHTKVTDDGRLQMLVGLPQLNDLDEMRARVERNDRLHLELHAANLSAAGFRFLGQEQRIAYLSLSRGTVSDADLEHLADAKLVELDLRNTNVTDAGLRHLEKMTTLNYLYLHDTQVTTDGVIQLKTKLPRCHIPRFPHDQP